MSDTTPTQGSWLKIARADTRGKILDFTDPNPAGSVLRGEQDKHNPKIAMNLCLYGQDNKATLQHRHWMDMDTLALLVWDILTNRKGEKTEKGYTPILDEFKGTDDVSRRLTVTYNDGLNIGPVYAFRFIVTKGETGANGQVMPVRGAKPDIDQTVNISVQEARTIALTLHSYLQAKMTVSVVRATQ